jgi:hypothetical protein
VAPTFCVARESKAPEIMVRFAFPMSPDARHSNTAISMSRDFVQQSAAATERVNNYFLIFCTAITRILPGLAEEQRLLARS